MVYVTEKSTFDEPDFPFSAYLEANVMSFLSFFDRILERFEDVLDY